MDIGCGNGALAIMLAKEFKEARITGIDYWGGGWAYSKLSCERNAKLEGVGDRLTFQEG